MIIIRCFACNELTENGYDFKTGRFYCEPCLEPTNAVILQQLDLEMAELFGGVLPTLDEEDEEFDLSVEDGPELEEI